MARQLVVVSGPDKGRTFPITGADILLVGRSKATQTVLTDPHVSRVHCQIEVEDGKVMLLDNESAAGTFVNGKRVTQHQLRSGDVIRIGETQLRYQDDEAAEVATVQPGAMPAVKPAAAPAGDKLTDLVGKKLSHHEVGEVIAKGQSGVIFKARDTKEDRDVALKVLKPEFSKNEDEMQRFIRAMKTMLPLRHPNLVALYGAGKTGAYCWIAMEYVEGESLTQVIQRLGAAGMLDWRHALRYAVHIGRALDFAAQHQIVHRNITPQNVLIRASDKMAKLGDLMLAKAMEGSLAQQITRPGELVGDINYMSPERTRGTTDIDARSDIYSLGALIYTLLTGRPPFEGGTLVETITKIRSAEPVKPKKYQLATPDLFEGTVLKMLAKRPEDRFQTPAEMLADLERVAKFQGMTI
jgi:pSer/pThr/pTyr-binding forkhead associated (FHA) protein